MKILKKILAGLAILNWVSHILGITQVALWDYLFSHKQLTDSWERFLDLLDYPAAHNLFIAPFISLIGIIISFILIMIGLKDPESSLKGECALFAAFSLTAILFSMSVGYSLLWF